MTDPWQGRTIAGCRIGVRESASASAHLFRARRELDAAPVGVLVIHPSPHRRVATAEQVLAVARRLGPLAAPGLPAVHDVQVHRQQLVMVTEPLRGETLDTAVRRGVLAPGAVEQLAVELAHSLAVLHQDGLRHGGLSTTRVLLTPKGARLLEVGVGLEGRDAMSEVVAVGSCLLVAAAGARAVDRVEPTAALQPMLPDWLATLIDDCRAAQPGRTPDNGVALLERVRSLRGAGTVSAVAPPAPPPGVPTARPAAPGGLGGDGSTLVPEEATGAVAPVDRTELAQSPAVDPESELPPEPEPASARAGIDVREAFFGLSAGIGAGLVIFGAIYFGLSLLTGGSSAPPEPVAVAPVPPPPPAPVDTGPSEAPTTYAATITSAAGTVVHLACLWDGETPTEEVPLLSGEAHTVDIATEAATCDALDPASGESLWSWSAEGAPEDGDAYLVEIPAIEVAPKPAPRRRAAPEPAPPPPKRAAPEPEEAEPEPVVSIRVEPSARLKKRRQGITVRIDGQKVGTAPVTARELSPGTHRVEATWEGESVICSVGVSSGSRTVLVNPAAGECGG